MRPRSPLSRRTRPQPSMVRCATGSPGRRSASVDTAIEVKTGAEAPAWRPHRWRRRRIDRAQMRALGAHKSTAALLLRKSNKSASILKIPLPVRHRTERKNLKCQSDRGGVCRPQTTLPGHHHFSIFDGLAPRWALTDALIKTAK